MEKRSKKSWIPFSLQESTINLSQISVLRSQISDCRLQIHKGTDQKYYRRRSLLRCLFTLCNLENFTKVDFFLHSSYAWSCDINKFTKPYQPMIKFLKLHPGSCWLKNQNKFKQQCRNKDLLL